MANGSNQSTKNSSYRKSRWTFCIVITLVSLFLIWPGYSLFSSATPFILGFPLSFAWVIFCTIAGFLALLALYLSDNRKNNEE